MKQLFGDFETMPAALDHYLAAWNLSDPQLLAQTVTSHVYTVTSGADRVVLKVLSAIGEEERVGAAALRYWDGRGAVRLLRVDEGAHLLEYAAGDDLIPLVAQGRDEQATARIVDVLNQLHAPSSQPIPDELTPLRTWFRALFARADADQLRGVDSRYVRAARLADDLLNDPLDVCVLHGDIHHFNIRYHAERGWLAFDPKGLIGERTYDAANTLCNPHGFPELIFSEQRLLTHAGILADGLRIDRWRVLAFLFVYVCLSACWYLEEGEHAEDDLRLAALVEPHLGL